MVGEGALVVVEGDLLPGQAADPVEQCGVVGLDLGDVVGAAGTEVGAVGVLSVQGIGGDHGAGEIDAVQQGLEGGDFVALVSDLTLGKNAAGVVHRGEQGDVRGGARAAQGLPVDRDRPQSRPGRGGAGGREGADRAVQGVAVELDHQAAQGVRVRDGHGAGQPVDGESEGRQAQAGASVIHSVIAVSERAPARTLAAAAVSSADIR